MRFSILLLATASLLSLGCGGEPRIAKVSGRITVGNKPVPTGIIMFHNETGRSATGEIQPDGSYTLTTFKKGDGAFVGEYVVTIKAFMVGPESSRRATPEEEQFSAQQGRKSDGPLMVRAHGTAEALVPEIYADPNTSPLKRTVENKVNEINFDIEK